MSKPRCSQSPSSERRSMARDSVEVHHVEDVDLNKGLMVVCWLVLDDFDSNIAIEVVRPALGHLTKSSLP